MTSSHSHGCGNIETLPVIIPSMVSLQVWTSLVPNKRDDENKKVFVSLSMFRCLLFRFQTLTKKNLVSKRIKSNCFLFCLTTLSIKSIHHFANLKKVFPCEQHDLMLNDGLEKASGFYNVRSRGQIYTHPKHPLWVLFGLFQGVIGCTRTNVPLWKSLYKPSLWVFMDYKSPRILIVFMIFLHFTVISSIKTYTF